jgi:hypothetical protein
VDPEQLKPLSELTLQYSALIFGNFGREKEKEKKKTIKKQTNKKPTP